MDYKSKGLLYTSFLSSRHYSIGYYLLSRKLDFDLGVASVMSLFIELFIPPLPTQIFW